MKCTPFETEVFVKMMEGRFPGGNIKQIIDEAVISNYEFSRAGYLLELTHQNINLENELIHSSVTVGKYGELVLDFNLFTEENTITLDCYSRDLTDVPKNIRELPIELTIEARC